MEYYLPMICAYITWLNLENIVLSERRQSQKATYFMTRLILNVQKR